MVWIICGCGAAFRLCFEPAPHRSPTNQIFSCKNGSLSCEDKFTKGFGGLNFHGFLLLEMNDRSGSLGRFVCLHAQELPRVAVEPFTETRKRVHIRHMAVLHP